MCSSPPDSSAVLRGNLLPAAAALWASWLLQVCQAIRRFYDAEPDKLESAKNKLLQYLQRANSLSPADLGSDLLERGLQQNTDVITQEGAGTRFPMIPYAGVSLGRQPV